MSGSYIYSGIEQTVSIAASDKYTISGNKGTAAADYSAAVTLTDTANYEWADGTKRRADLAMDDLFSGNDHRLCHKRSNSGSSCKQCV